MTGGIAFIRLEPTLCLRLRHAGPHFRKKFILSWKTAAPERPSLPSFPHPPSPFSAFPCPLPAFPSHHPWASWPLTLRKRFGGSAGQLTRRDPRADHTTACVRATIASVRGLSFLLACVMAGCATRARHAGDDGTKQSQFAQASARIEDKPPGGEQSSTGHEAGSPEKSGARVASD